MKNACFLLLCLFLFSCSNEAVNNKIANLEKELDTAKAQLLEANAQAEQTPGLIHNVFFWLKADISEADEAAFLEGARSLKAISTIKECYIGPPAATEDRNVIDNSYSYALLVHFDDIAGQDAYQIDPIHLKFVEDHKDKWTKVIVYDNEVE